MGEHTDLPDGDPPDPAVFRRAVDRAIQIGFERTLDQDAAFGTRQLVDVVCKALSPAVNDPYTAIQSIDHLSVIFCALARRPLGDYLVRDTRHRAAVIIPGRRFGDYLSTMCGLIRRDLDAAREHGLRTAYLDRGGDGRPSVYDFTARDLTALLPHLT